MNNADFCPLADTIESYALFVKEDTDKSDKPVKTAGEPFVFFGSGISASKGASKGLGFEYLEFITAAVLAAQTSGCNKVVQLISDMDSGLSPSEVQNIVDDEKKLIWRIFQRINQNSPVKAEILCSSDLADDNKAFLNMAKSRPWQDELSGYTFRQLADTEYLRQKGGFLKLGWTNGGPLSDKTRDERYFNALQKRAFPNAAYNFVYTMCAYDLQGGRRPPYTVVGGEDRFILGKTNISQELEQRYTRGGQKFSKSLRNFLRRMNYTLPQFEKISGLAFETDSLVQNPQTDKDFFTIGAKLDELQKTIVQPQTKGLSDELKTFRLAAASGRQ